MTVPSLTLDSHVHIWDWQLDGYDWMDASMSAIRRPVTVEELRRELAAHEVMGAILVQTCASLRETREYLQLAAGTEEIVGVIGWVDLTDPSVGEVIADLRSGPGGDLLVGVRHLAHDEEDADWLDRPDVRRGIRTLGEQDLVYDVLVRPRELPAAARLVQDLDEQAYVIDHIAKPRIDRQEIEPWASWMERFASKPHVRCKLSGLVTEADWARWKVEDLQPFTDQVLSVFGPERLLFGADWPVCTLAADYGQVLEAARALTSDLSQADRDRIFHGTALEVYGVEVEA